MASWHSTAAQVRNEAISEVERMQNHPSLKWTWGVSMDIADLEHLHGSIYDGNQDLYSGYYTTLMHRSDTWTTLTLTHDIANINNGYFSDISIEAQQPVMDLDPKNVPDCLYQHIWCKPSCYLIGLCDDSQIPMDTIDVSSKAAMPFKSLIPPPIQYFSFLHWFPRNSQNSRNLTRNSRNSGNLTWKFRNWLVKTEYSYVIY